MWAIKILNGPQQGKIIPLSKGNNVLGRSHNADIRIKDTGISKTHAKIYVTADKVIISDLNSSNGTFVNGVLVQNHGIKTGDKVLVNKTIFTLFQLPDNVVFADKQQAYDPGLKSATQDIQVPAQAQPPAVSNQGTNAMALQQDPQNALSTDFASPSLAAAPMANSEPVQNQTALQQIVSKTEEYIDTVALPPLYRSTEKFEFKYVLMGTFVLLIMLVTFLSALPLSQLATESVIKESQRRVLTLSRNLAQMNRKAMAAETELALRTDFITRESGVEKAFIISAKNGSILAPPTSLGQFLTDAKLIGFKGIQEEQVRMIDETLIAAAVPMKFYDSVIGDSIVKGLAIVVYRIDSIAVDGKRTFSLFIQIFMIALLLSSIIFAAQYRLFLYPLRELNKNIDSSLREGTSDIHVPFQLPIFQDLVSNINSALSRMTADESGDVSANLDKGVEAAEVTSMFPVPAFAIDPDSFRFIALNQHIVGHPLFDVDVVLDASIEDLTDRSLYESLKDLIETAHSNPNSRHANTIPTTDSENYEITVKLIIENNQPSYLLFTVMEILSDEEMEV